MIIAYCILLSILTIISLLITITYILINPEQGSLLEYQKSSDYKFVKLSNGLTAFKEFGSNKNIPIIIIHGGTLPSEGYIEFCQRLSEFNYWVICYDQYGRGYSDRPQIKYSIDIYRNQLDELLKYLKVKKFILYGISMGGPIAVDYANSNINNTLAMGLQVPVVNINNNIFKFLKIPIVGNIFMRFFGLPIIKKRALKWNNDALEREIFINKYIKQLNLPGTEYALLSSVRHLFSKDYISNYINFSNHKIPTHISYADDDEEVSPESVKSVIKFTDHANIFVFSGGHTGSAKIPEKIISVFIDYLDSSLN